MEVDRWRRMRPDGLQEPEGQGDMWAKKARGFRRAASRSAGIGMTPAAGSTTGACRPTLVQRRLDIGAGTGAWALDAGAVCKEGHGREPSQARRLRCCGKIQGDGARQARRSSMARGPSLGRGRPFQPGVGPATTAAPNIQASSTAWMRPRAGAASCSRRGATTPRPRPWPRSPPYLGPAARTAPISTRVQRAFADGHLFQWFMEDTGLWEPVDRRICSKKPFRRSRKLGRGGIQEL